MAWNDDVVNGIKLGALETVGLKSGSMFVAARYNASLASAANQDTVVLTGSKPVLLFTRFISKTGSTISSTIYQTPTYTGGTAGTVYKQNVSSNTSPTLSFLTGTTVTGTGTQIVPTAYQLSTAGVLGAGGGSGELGSPVYLPANSSFLFRITNTDASAQQVYAQIVFYEGNI